MKHFFLKSTFPVLVFLLLSVLIMSGCNNNKNSSSTQPAKVYVANEEGGSVSVIDLQDSLKNTNINMSDSGKMYMAHNVQVSPDGKSVWV